MITRIFPEQRVRRAAVLAVFAISTGMLAFPQQAPIGPPPSQNQPTPPPTEKPAPAIVPKSEGGAAVSESYKIGPADVLKINVWGEDRFSGLYTVDQDGNFVFPLVGNIKAGGLTTADVKENVDKALVKYVVKPRIDVTVQQVESKKYYLNGMVNHPGEYLLVTPITVMQAISKAGGLQDFANQKKIYILRGSTKIPFNYKEVSQGKKMEQNIFLQSDDQVFVP